MKPSYRLFVAVALFAVGAVCWSLGSSPAQEREKAKPKGDKVERVVVAPAVPKWEYKVESLHPDPEQADKDLAKLGDEGWELVGTVSNVNAGPNGGRISTNARLFFKRPKK